MKRLVIIVASALIGLTANAQIFLGGSLGFQHYSISEVSAQRSDKKDNYSNGFNIGPEIGYRFNDKWSAGVKLIYAPAVSHAIRTEEDGISKLGTWTNRWDISLYGRRSVWGTNGFNICLQGELLGSVFNRKSSIAYPDSYDDETNKLHGYELQVAFYPVLTYDISRHVTLFSELNLLGINYMINHTTGENTSENERYCYTEDRISRGFNLNFNSRAEINFGILYMF